MIVCVPSEQMIFHFFIERLRPLALNKRSDCKQYVLSPTIYKYQQNHFKAENGSTITNFLQVYLHQRKILFQKAKRAWEDIWCLHIIFESNQLRINIKFLDNTLIFDQKGKQHRDKRSYV